jgi:hypothetical protein
MSYKRKQPSFETPRKRAAPQDDGDNDEKKPGSIRARLEVLAT